MLPSQRLRQHAQSGEAVSRQISITSECEQPIVDSPAPARPRSWAQLWTIFHALHATRGSNGFGLSPITLMDIRLWEADECRRLEGWERAVLLKVDAVFLRSTWAPEEKAPVEG